MSYSHPLRVLVLSDLHFSDKRPHKEKLDAKVILPPGPVDLRADLVGKFTQSLTRALNREPKAPVKAVIVCGDLTDRSAETEFENARKFLEELAKSLEIEQKSVYVVPGNHDVNWESSGADTIKLARYFKAVKDYKSPEFNEGKIQPHFDESFGERHSPDTTAPYKLELALIASPTFSGIQDETLDRLLREMVDEGSLSPETRDAILSQLPPVESILGDLIQEGKLDRKSAAEILRHLPKIDAAALGHQKFRIPDQKYYDENLQPLRIAVLHHNLLPDVGVEVKNFEAVIDGGETISVLLQKGFDLVLTGHKHRRQLTYLHSGGHGMHFYSCPSLFSPADNRPESLAAFTLLDIYGKDHPFWGQVSAYALDANSEEPLFSERMVRRSRISRALSEACTEIEPQDQQSAAALLKSMSVAYKWSRNHRANRLFGEAWGKLRQDLNNLENQIITFRQPELHHYWSELMNLAGQSEKVRIRLISYNDVSYWLKRTDNASETSRYARPLQEIASKIPGSVHRIIILRKSRLLDSTYLANAKRAIALMEQDKLLVSVCYEETLEWDIPRLAHADFGVINDIAVTHFRHHRSPARSLEVELSTESIAEATRDWENLNQHYTVWHSKTGVDFQTFVRDDPDRLQPTELDLPPSIE